MQLRYPISSELFTFVHELNRSVERALRRECGLSVVQYRALSCLKQAGELREGALARTLAAGASYLSQELGSLSKRGLVLARTHQGPTKLWRLSEAGQRALADADLVLVEACNRVFGPLGSDLGSAIRAGSMLTNQRHGVVRIENGKFFEEHACFEAFLQAEQITKESTRGYGLTETQFRIMFELFLKGPQTKSTLAKTLMMAPSAVTDACKQLQQRRLVYLTPGKTDRRTVVVSLTASGRNLTRDAAEFVDRRSFEDLRPSSVEERALYQQMADIVVHRADAAIRVS